MKREFNISSFHPDMVGELASFLREEYPSGDISKESYLLWEYMHNPSGKAIVVLARNAAGKIISQYALAPMILFDDGNQVSATLSLNTLTANEYRGKGLFISTAGDAFKICAERGMSFTYGIPNSNSYPGFTRRLGFTHAGNLVFMAKPLNAISILPALMNRRNKKKGDAIEFNADKNWLKKNFVSELEFPADEKTYHDFLDRWNQLHSISIYRTAEYLNWRYVQNPLRKYTLFKFMVDEQVKATVMIRTMHLYGMRVCLVMDHMSIDNACSKKLLDLISAEAKRNKIDLMIAVAASKENLQFRQLSKAGFWSVPALLLPQQLPFITRIHNNADYWQSRLNNLRNWHFSFGDYDVF